MNDTTLILIYPLLLGKIKPYQNLSLITSGVISIIAFIFSWFDNKFLSLITNYLLFASCISITLFIILSLPFLFLEKREIVVITDDIIHLKIDRKPTEFNIQKLEFLFNIDRKDLENKNIPPTELIKSLSVWGNYIVISSEISFKKTYVQFLPNEQLLNELSKIKIKTYRKKSILMYDTTELLRKFIWMIWGAS